MATLDVPHSPVAAKAPTTDKPASFELHTGSLEADGRYANTYTHGECGVRSLVYQGGAGDGGLGPSLDWSRAGRTDQQTCGNQPRRIGIAYGNGQTETVTNLAIYDLGSVTRPYTLGNSAPTLRVGQAGLNTAEGICGLVSYGIEDGSSRLAITPGDPINGKRVWHVTTTGEHMAWCKNVGELRAVPFTLTVREKP